MIEEARFNCSTFHVMESEAAIAGPFYDLEEAIRWMEDHDAGSHIEGSGNVTLH